MSKGNRRRSSARTRRQQGNSLLIPIVVGLVVVVMIVGIILSVEDQTPTANTLQGNTALPLSTGSLPNPDVSRISLEETRTKLEQGQAILIDVRSSESFEKSHAQGAISIPEEEVGGRLDELPHDKEIILYCT